jgi:hypothetical protein
MASKKKCSHRLCSKLGKSWQSWPPCSTLCTGHPWTRPALARKKKTKILTEEDFGNSREKRKEEFYAWHRSDISLLTQSSGTELVDAAAACTEQLVWLPNGSAIAHCAGVALYTRPRKYSVAVVNRGASERRDAIAEMFNEKQLVSVTENQLSIYLQARRNSPAHTLHSASPANAY